MGNSADTATRYHYTIIEDNGGGLTLCFVDEARDACSLAFTGWEHCPWGLRECLAGLADGTACPEDWDGAASDPQQLYDDLVDLTSLRNGGARIISSDGATDSYEHMGAAGRSVFYPDGPPAVEEE